MAGCGGTILQHRGRGDYVCVAYVTDGRRSRAFGLTPGEMARRRRLEATAAAGALAVEQIEWLDLPEGEWRDHELREALRTLLGRLSPDLVYAPSRIDFHPEHYRVAQCLAHVLADWRPTLTPLVRIYQVQVPLTRALTNVVAPLGPVMHGHLAAVRLYTTQIGSLVACLRMKRYAAALHGVAGQAEEFWQLTAAQYCALHNEPPPRPLVQTFRGLRTRPFTDPLAYLRGRAERWRLAQLVSDIRTAP